MEEGEFAFYRPAPFIVRMLTKGPLVSECQTQDGKIVHVDNLRLDKPFTPHDSTVADWPEPNPNRAVRT